VLDLKIASKYQVVLKQDREINYIQRFIKISKEVANVP
jgi:hypothetical protein